MFIITIISLNVLLVHAQEGDLQPFQKDTSHFSDLPANDAKKVTFGVSTGMNFSSFGKGAGGTGTFVYPSANIRVNKKLDLDLGTYFMRSNYSGLSSFGSRQIGDFVNKNINQNQTSGFVNARATYNVTEKFHIEGMIMKGFGNSNQLMQNYYNNLSLMGIGVNYEILPNLSIGAQFNYYEAPSYYSPYFAPSYFSPFSTPFEQRTGN